MTERRKKEKRKGERKKRKGRKEERQDLRVVDSPFTMHCCPLYISTHPLSLTSGEKMAGRVRFPVAVSCLLKKNESLHT